MLATKDDPAARILALELWIFQCIRSSIARPPQQSHGQGGRASREASWSGKGTFKDVQVSQGYPERLAENVTHGRVELCAELSL